MMIVTKSVTPVSGTRLHGITAGFGTPNQMEDVLRGARILSLNTL